MSDTQVPSKERISALTAEQEARALEIQEDCRQMPRWAARTIIRYEDRSAELWGAFKNFHRLLCERFGYVHDEKDWDRDQLSLIEHIATRPTPEPRAELERYRSYEHIEAQHGETGRIWTGARYKLPVGFHEVSNESGVTDEQWAQRGASQLPVPDLAQRVADLERALVDSAFAQHRTPLRQLPPGLRLINNDTVEVLVAGRWIRATAPTKPGEQS